MLQYLALLASISLCAHARDDGLVSTPLMGWSSWNFYHRSISDHLFRSTADAMETNGLLAAGYNVIAIDGGWWEGVDTGHAVRNSTGYMGVDKKKFPYGMKPMVDYLHGKGFLYEHYTDSGVHFCNRDQPASYGYEHQDAQLFASWGVDGLKLDACGSKSDQWKDILTKWDAEFKAASGTYGRNIWMNDCHNGCQYDLGTYQDWCPQLANVWRATKDIQDNWESIMFNVHAMAGHGHIQAPGQWATPDILEVGNSLSAAEDQTHFSLWAITSSPLLMGNNMSAITPALVTMVTNREVIRVDQTYCGNGGDLIEKFPETSTEVWAKPQPGGAVAVVMASVGDLQGETTVSIPLSKLPFNTPGVCGDTALEEHPLGGVPLQQWATHEKNGRNGAAVQQAGVRNLVTHQFESVVTGNVTCKVQQHGSCTLLVTPVA